MGKTKITKKKKGRPTKADLGRQDGFRRKTLDRSSENELRRSIRRRNLTYHDDFYEDVEVEDEDEDDDDEDERREKKLKLVLKLPHKAEFGGVDSSTNLIRTEDNVAHASAPAKGAAVSASSSDYGEGNKPLKKRKIDGDEAAYGKGDNADCDGEDDAHSIGSHHREKEGTNLDTAQMASAPESVPLPDKKSLELILDKLQKKDTYGVYAEPVDPEELPDYHDVVKHPMDFGTVRKKLASGDYSTLEQFESDIFLICTNAMQYNAPETIYFKQARSIQDLGRKKFHRLRIDIVRSQKELKLEQKTKSNFTMKKPTKKPYCRTVQEPVGSDFSSGTTLATTGDTHIWSNMRHAGGCEKPNNIDGLIDGNSSLNDNKADKTEEQHSGKGLQSKFGRKLSVIDENRRSTYNLSSQPTVRTDSIFRIFEGESKQLVDVGLHACHHYARSLARFAAALGPVAWKIASRKIEQSLPVGVKFGHGWVGSYEPLPIPILMLDSSTQKQLAYGTNLNHTAASKKENSAERLKTMQVDANLGFKTRNSLEMAASHSTEELAMVSPVSGSTLDGKLFSFAGTRPITGSTSQQQKSITTAKSDIHVFKKAELNNCSVGGNPSVVAPPKQFDHGSEMTTSRFPDMVSQNRDLVQSVPLKQKKTNGVAAGELPNGKALSGSVDGIKVNSSSPDFVSNQHSREVPYLPHGNKEQGIRDPVFLMRMLGEKTQNPQRSSNHTLVAAQQAMQSSPSLIRDDSDTATRSWMPARTTLFNSTENLTMSKMQIAAASVYNSAREHPPVSRFFEESHGSGVLQLQNGRDKFPPQAFLPQPVHYGDETRSQSNTPVVLPQLLTADLSRFQMQPQWRGLLSHTEPKQKLDTVPPDLNVGFQSSGSPGHQSSGILVDSQQPDLALQL